MYSSTRGRRVRERRDADAAATEGGNLTSPVQSIPCPIVIDVPRHGGFLDARFILHIPEFSL